eukprot:COSAG02_NODE_96_length_37408_cov_9.762604_7_plen_87_part_00
MVDLPAAALVESVRLASSARRTLTVRRMLAVVACAATAATTSRTVTRQPSTAVAVPAACVMQDRHAPTTAIASQDCAPTSGNCLMA